MIILHIYNSADQFIFIAVALLTICQAMEQWWTWIGSVL